MKPWTGVIVRPDHPAPGLSAPDGGDDEDEGMCAFLVFATAVDRLPAEDTSHVVFLLSGTFWILSDVGPPSIRWVVDSLPVMGFSVRSLGLVATIECSVSLNPFDRMREIQLVCLRGRRFIARVPLAVGTLGGWVDSIRLCHTTVVECIASSIEAVAPISFCHHELQRSDSERRFWIATPAFRERRDRNDSEYKKPPFPEVLKFGSIRSRFGQ